jgi:predicted transcriptional regulator
MSKIMRISDNTADLLNQLAKETKKTKSSLIEKAVSAYAQELFVRAANQEYARVNKGRKDKSLEKELKIWDVTLSDGLDNDW